MTGRMLGFMVIVTICGAAVLLMPPARATAAPQPSLQPAGNRLGSSYAWPKYNADSRSFRFQGLAGRSYRGASTSHYSIFAGKSVIRGSTIRSNLASSLRTGQRSYGYTGRYSHRRKIVSYRRYQRPVQANRGSTIRVRR